MLRDGGIIMVVGMSVVFLFLILIVLSMRIMSSVILKFFPEKEEIIKVKSSAEAEIAVALAAVQAYKQS